MERGVAGGVSIRAWMVTCWTQGIFRWTFWVDNVPREMLMWNMIKKQCPCGRERRNGGGWCLECHARWMRENRPRLSEEARVRANARSKAHVYLKRGKLERKGCEVCGGVAQMHHEDYGRPLEVRWFCRAHHLELHRLGSGQNLPC